MARPQSDKKRLAIIDHATGLIAAEGVGAPTARIARAAGIAEGTLFTYFRTKDALLNQLYVALKREITSRILTGYPEFEAPRHQLEHVWRAYVDWGLENTEKRRALAQLSLSHRVSAETLAIANNPLAAIADLIAGFVRADAEMPLVYASAAMTALADMTIDLAADRPGERESLTEVGFLALLRVFRAA